MYIKVSTYIICYTLSLCLYNNSTYVTCFTLNGILEQIPDICISCGAKKADILRIILTTFANILLNNYTKIRTAGINSLKDISNTGNLKKRKLETFAK